MVAVVQRARADPRESITQETPRMQQSNDNFFILLMVVATVLLGWLLYPLYGAVLWGTVIAILFAPLNRMLRRDLEGRRNLAALATLSMIVTLVILPLTLIGLALAQQAAAFYGRVESGQIDVSGYFQTIVAHRPDWVDDALAQFGIGSISELPGRLSSILTQGGQYLAGKAIGIGQSTVDFTVNLFVMVYLLFFLLRDGDRIAAKIRRALPLPEEQENRLLGKFTVVIRATVKGNMLIALIQGALGGLIFYILGISGALLWGVVMAFMSLLPAVGAGIVWLPVAIYLIATGSVWQGVVLIAFGALVIGMVDNVLRPVFVGKDTKMPDYVVLISTLGGLEVFGLNGFVLGPVIAAMFIAVWDIYAEGREQDTVRPGGEQ